MSLSDDYKKKLQFILNQMENRNQLFQILDQILVKVQFYQLPLHKITQILKLLQMPEVSDPGQIKYNTFVGINKLYQKYKDKIALHIYQDKFSHLSKEMKQLLYIVFININQIMLNRQNSNANLYPYYNTSYMYSSIPNMQQRIIPDPFYMNMQANPLLKDPNLQMSLLGNQNYKNYYEQQAKNYYNSLMNQNSQGISNNLVNSSLNHQKAQNNINSNISQNMQLPQKTSTISGSNVGSNLNNANNSLLSQGSSNYMNSPGLYQPSYMDYMKAYQAYVQNSYIYSSNQQKLGNLMYKGYSPYQPMPDNVTQMMKKNMYQRQQPFQNIDDKKKFPNEGKNISQFQSQKGKLISQKPLIAPLNQSNYSNFQQQNGKKNLNKNITPIKNIIDPEIEIIPKSINNSKQEKRLSQQNKLFSYCACKGYYAYQDYFVCCICKRHYHNTCLNQSVRKSEQSKAKIECSICKISNIDPLNKVQKVIGQFFLVNLSQQKFQATVNFKQFQSLFFPQKNSKYEVQMRCIRSGDFLDHLQITWPDECIIKINGQKIIDIPALQSNSSLKKRKDYAVTLTQNIYGKHIHDNSNILEKVRISLQVKNLTPQQLQQKKIKNDFTFVLGIYLIEKLTVDELFQKVVKQVQQKNQTQKQNTNYFKYLMFTNSSQNSEENQVQIQQITINLTDPFSWELINIPARGSRCHHGSCFDLKTFISFMSTAKNRTWKCPICGKDVRKFVIDIQQQYILKKAAQLNPIPKQVCVFKDSTMAFKIDNQSEDQSQKQKKSNSELSKTKKIHKDKKEESK